MLYDQEKDAGFCFTCIEVTNQKLPLGSKSDPTYTEMGYHNWKHNLDEEWRLLEHDIPESHEKAVAFVSTEPAISKNAVDNDIFKQSNREQSWWR